MPDSIISMTSHTLNLSLCIRTLYYVHIYDVSVCYMCTIIKYVSCCHTKEAFNVLYSTFNSLPPSPKWARILNWWALIAHTSKAHLYIYTHTHGVMKNTCQSLPRNTAPPKPTMKSKLIEAKRKKTHVTTYSFPTHSVSSSSCVTICK